MTRKWIVLIGLSIVTVVVWTFIEITIRFFREETVLDYEHFRTPISSTFNEESLNDIVTREKEKLLVDRDALE